MEIRDEESHVVDPNAGYDQGVLGGLIALPKFLSDNHISPNNASLAGTIVSLYDVGCLTGAIVAGVIGQRFGRRMFIVAGGVFLMAGAGLQAGAHGSTLLIVGRLIGGIGNGLNTTMVPIWVAETATARNRGTLMSCQMVMVITGLTISYWFDFGMFHHHPHSTAVWRLPLAFQGVFVIMNWCTIFFLPESPRYLYAKGHTEDADAVMARIYSVPVESQALVDLRLDVLSALEAEKEYKFRIKDLFWDHSPVRSAWRLWLSALVQLWQQMDGNNLVSYYATYLFIHSLGMSDEQASVTSGGVTLLFWGGMVTTVYTVEHFGRRPVMLWGAVFCSLFMILFTIGLGINNKASAKLAVTSIFLFQFSFGMSWANVSWVYSVSAHTLSLRTRINDHTSLRLCPSTFATSAWLWPASLSGSLPF
jgi:sugar porter (SP) family MFS transporter